MPPGAAAAAGACHGLQWRGLLHRAQTHRQKALLPGVFATAFCYFSKDFPMSLSLSIGPLVSLIAGILILVMPRLLSTIVALYLIIMGILGLLGMHTLKF